MDANPNLAFGTRKEIRCRDCGHIYSVAVGQRSSRCEVCGNIEFHTDAAPIGTTAPRAAVSGTGATTVVTSYLAPAEPIDPNAKILARFQITPRGPEVQEILVRYQVEWQLWAMLVKNFEDPAFHGAYLAMAVQTHAFDQATKRYQEHRSVMALSPETHWQAEISELMLSRLELLTSVRMEQEGGAGFRLPHWLQYIPINSRPFRIAWILLGMFLVARAFHKL
jgi:hypothetical protein